MEEVLSLIGGEAVDRPTGFGFIAVAVELQIDPGGETVSRDVLLSQGTWVVDCHTIEPSAQGPAQLWFVGAIESS